MQQLWAVLGPEGSKIVVWVMVGLGIAIGLAILLWLLTRLFGRNLNMSGGGGRGQPQRLGITGAFNVDRKGRKLVIIRRDNVEHLVLIGGPNDVLVESNIVRAQPARPQSSRTETIDGVEPVVAPPLAPVVAPVPPPAPQPVAPPVQIKPAPTPPVQRREPPVEPPPLAIRTPEPPRAVVPPASQPAEPRVPVQTDVKVPPLEPSPPPVAIPPEPAVDSPVRPARPASADPRLSDMARRLQSVLQKPLTPAPKPVAPPSEMVETVPIPLPSTRKAETPAPSEPSKPQAPTSLPQGKALSPEGDKTQPASIDSLEEEMARLLGRSDPAKT